MQKLTDILLDSDSDLFSLRNEDTRSLTLYVMQNAYGLIKIGRSKNPEIRRCQIEQSTHCEVVLINTAPQCGHLEEWIHRQLEEYRVCGEWFNGSQELHLAVERLFRMKFEWPYKYNQLDAENWLDAMKFRMMDTYWRNRQRKLIRNLKAAILGIGLFEDFKNGSVLLDGRIAILVGYENWQCNADGIYKCTFEDDDELIDVPPFTQSMNAANLLWPPLPEGIQRKLVTTPMDCCLAALCERWYFNEEKLKPLAGF